MKKKSAIKDSKPLYRLKPPKRKMPLGRGERLAHVSSGIDSCFLGEELPELPPRRAPRCVELFAGAGGLALAASNTGFEHDAVLEYNHDACETIRANQRRGYELVRHWHSLRATFIIRIFKRGTVAWTWFREDRPASLFP